ncbi:lasso peptide isopeptide bond-forming cyclase [soil metagenome]
MVDRADADPDAVLGMLNAMGTRGPVERFGSTSGPACFGAGHLPFRPADGFELLSSSVSGQDWLIAADSRLDDPEALRQRLGGPPRGSAALILDAYRTWGEAAMDRLEGDFAFAIWDPERQSVFFARDRFGVKPFFFLEQPGRFVFASEAKGLLAHARTPRRVPRIRIAEFLAGEVPPEGESFFADIRRVPAGSCGTVGEGGVRVRRYWTPVLPERSTDQDPATTFRSLFEEAVNRRITPGAPLVSMLSGGLDSSSITSVARRLLADRGHLPLHTVSMIFPDHPGGDETRFIDSLLTQGGYAPGYIKISQFDPFAGFRDSMRIQDSLVLAPGLEFNRDIYRALPTGCVMLSGHGGDEVVSKGEGHLNDLARARDWKGLWKATGGVADLYGSSHAEVFWSFFQAFGPGRYKIRAFRRALARVVPNRNKGDATLLSGTLAAQYGAEIGKGTPSKHQLEGRALDLATLAGPLQPYALEVLDRESAAAGVESRYPFWDQRLLEFSMSLDPSTKLKDGWTRMVLREAMGQDLPDDIRWRRDKYDFSSVIIQGLLKSPAASRQRLQGAREALSTYVDLDRVEVARARLQAGSTATVAADVQALWRTTALAEWLEYSAEQGFTLL